MQCATKECYMDAMEKSFLCSKCQTAESMRQYHQMRYHRGDVETGCNTPQRSKRRSMLAYPDRWEERDCPVCGTHMDTDDLDRSNRKYCSKECKATADVWSRKERRQKAKTARAEKPQEFKLMLAGKEVKL